MQCTLSCRSNLSYFSPIKLGVGGVDAPPRLSTLRIRHQTRQTIARNHRMVPAVDTRLNIVLAFGVRLCLGSEFGLHPPSLRHRI